MLPRLLGRHILPPLFIILLALLDATWSRRGHHERKHPQWRHRHRLQRVDLKKYKHVSSFGRKINVARKSFETFKGSYAASSGLQNAELRNLRILNAGEKLSGGHKGFIYDVIDVGKRNHNDKTTQVNTKHDSNILHSPISDLDDYVNTPKSKKQEIYEEYDDDGNQESIQANGVGNEEVIDSDNDSKSAIIYVGERPRGDEASTRGQTTSQSISLDHLKGIVDADEEVSNVVNSILDDDSKLVKMMSGGAPNGGPTETVPSYKGGEGQDFDVTIDEDDVRMKDKMGQHSLPQLAESKILPMKVPEVNDDDDNNLLAGASKGERQKGDQSTVSSSGQVIHLEGVNNQIGDSTNMNDNNISNAYGQTQTLNTTYDSVIGIDKDYTLSNTSTMNKGVSTTNIMTWNNSNMSDVKNTANAIDDGNNSVNNASDNDIDSNTVFTNSITSDSIRIGNDSTYNNDNSRDEGNMANVFYSNDNSNGNSSNFNTKSGSISFGNGNTNRNNSSIMLSVISNSSTSMNTNTSDNNSNNNITISYENLPESKQNELQQMTSKFLDQHPSSYQILLQYFQNETALQKQLQNRLRNFDKETSTTATKKSNGQIPIGSKRLSVGSYSKENEETESHDSTDRPLPVKQFIENIIELITPPNLMSKEIITERLDDIMSNVKNLSLYKSFGNNAQDRSAGKPFNNKIPLSLNIGYSNAKLPRTVNGLSLQTPKQRKPSRKANVELFASFDNVTEVLRKINITQIFQSGGVTVENGAANTMETIDNISNTRNDSTSASGITSNAIQIESNAVPLNVTGGSKRENSGSQKSNSKGGPEKNVDMDSAMLMYKKQLKSLEFSLSQDFFSTWIYHYRSFEEINIKPSKLRSGIATLGSTDRLERVIRKALKGQTVNIMVVGGSISAGGGLERDSLDVRGVYYNAFVEWWKNTISSITNSQLKLNIIAIGGTDSEYFSYCIKNYIHDNPDLVLWELAANDYRRYVDRNMNSAKPLEQLTRVLLTIPSHPALIFVNFFRGDYYRTTVGQDCPDSEDEGGEIIAEYYKITSLSWRNVICSEMKKDMVRRKREVPLLTLKTLFSSDGYHPSLLGHAQSATLLISYVRGVFEEVLSQEIKRIDEGGSMNDGIPFISDDDKLPNPIYNDPKTPRPLCWTLLTSDYRYKVDNRLPQLRITEANGFEFVNITHWPIRLDRLRCLKAMFPGAKMKIKFNAPPRDGRDGNTNRELVVVSHNSYSGIARIWLDESEAAAKTIVEPKGQRRTQVHVMTRSLKPGVHFITFKSIGVGFCLSALAVL